MFKCLIESDLECSFQFIFLSTNIICPIVVSYFPVSVLASMPGPSSAFRKWYGHLNTIGVHRVPMARGGGGEG